MKRKTVLRLLCISIVSAMLISSPGMVFAHEKGEKRLAVYEGKQIEVIIDGDYVILPDEERILLEEFAGEFVEGKELEGGEPSGEEKPSDGNASGGEKPSGEDLSDGKISEGEKPSDGAEPSEGDDSAEGQLPERKLPEDKSAEDTAGKKDAAAGTDKYSEEKADKEEKDKGTEDSFAGPPVITAGIGFYVEELSEKYQLTFEDEFKDTVSEIEEEFLAEVKHTAPEKEKQERVSRLTKNLLLREDQEPENTKEDETVFTNWQDVLAVYLLEENKSGAETFVMDASDKEGIAAVFKRMNHGVMTDGKAVITAKTVEDYEAEKKNLSGADHAFLEKYTSRNCSLLCASATGIQGFIVESLGKDVSRERARIVEAAYSLVGKIPYYYGGKSSVIGWDLRWGKPEFITASGILQTPKAQEYGLDCSGFVTWAFINGYDDERAAWSIGHGTSSQWNSCVPVSEEDALPGDLVFLAGPAATGPNNHVGIVAGRNDDGKLVVIHCNGSDNGVVVESAYSAGFRYVRRPVMFEE